MLSDVLGREANDLSLRGVLMFLPLRVLSVVFNTVATKMCLIRKSRIALEIHLKRKIYVQYSDIEHLR